jgi:hypothetical protein
MSEYLDAVDSDSDFIPESDTNDTSEEEENVTAPTAQPVLTMKRMTWIVNTIGKFVTRATSPSYLLTYLLTYLVTELSPS